MSNDIQGSVTADTAPAVAAINQVTGAVDKLTSKTKAANKETQDLQKRVNGQFKEASAGVARAGGPVGSIGGRILGGAGMGGTLGAASVALAALTTVIGAVGAASSRAVEQMGRQIEAENKLTEARTKAEKDIDAQAKAGAAQAPVMRNVIAMGGPAAVKALEKLEKKGIDTPTAAAGLQAIMIRYPNQALDARPSSEVIFRASMLTELGMKFDDAVKALVARGGMDSPESSARQAQLIYKQFTGQRGDPGKIFDDAMYNVRSNAYLKDVKKSAEIEGAIPAIQRGQVGSLEMTARENLAAAVDPLSKHLVEANALAVKQLDAMQRMANEQFALMRWLTTSGRAFGLSAGSEQQKLNDIIEARAAAINRTEP